MVSGVRAAFVVATMLALLACSGDRAGGPSSDPAPIVSGEVLTFNEGRYLRRGAQAFIVGDTVTLEVVAESEGDIEWIGVHATVPTDWRDSVSVPNSLRHGVQVQWQAWFGPDYTGVARFNGFARSRGGVLTEIELPGNPVSFYESVPWPRRTVSIPARAPLYVLSPDATRLYIALEGRSQVDVLSLTSMTFETPIALPAPPTGIDLVPSGDSLVVVFKSPTSLAVVRLTSGVQAGDVAMIPLTMPSPLLWPSYVTVAANRKAFVILTTGSTGTLLEFDLAAGTQRRRLDVGSGSILAGSHFARAHDHSRLALIQPFLPPRSALSPYDTTEDSFGSSPESDVEASYGHLTFDLAGARALFGSELLDGRLRPVASFYVPGEMRVSAISPDGRTLYFRGATGLRMSLIRVAADSGVVWDDVPLSSVPEHLLAVPGTAKVLALTSSTIDLLDFSGARPIGTGRPTDAGRAAAAQLRVAADGGERGSRWVVPSASGYRATDISSRSGKAPAAERWR